MLMSLTSLTSLTPLTPKKKVTSKWPIGKHRSLSSAQYPCAFQAHKWVSEVEMKNSSFFALQKPRITLFYTCQAVRLCESRHDAFACKRAYSKAIYHSSVPLALTRIKKKNPAPFGQKKQNSHASTLTGTITGTGTTLSLVPCHFVLRMVFVK